MFKPSSLQEIFLDYCCCRHGCCDCCHWNMHHEFDWKRNGKIFRWINNTNSETNKLRKLLIKKLKQSGPNGTVWYAMAIYIWQPNHSNISYCLWQMNIFLVKNGQLNRCFMWMCLKTNAVRNVYTFVRVWASSGWSVFVCSSLFISIDTNTAIKSNTEAHCVLSLHLPNHWMQHNWQTVYTRLWNRESI